MEQETVVVSEKKKFDWNNLLIAAVMLLIGVAILIWPGELSMILVYILAGIITLVGIVRVILYFARHETNKPFAFGGLSLGLSLTAIGVFLLLDPKVLRAALPILLGCLLVFSGFGSVQTGFELLRAKVGKWYVPLIIGVIGIVCGFLALLSPFTAANALMIFLGISFCAEAVLLIVTLFLVR